MQNLAKEEQFVTDPMEQKKRLSGITDRGIGRSCRPAVGVLISLCVGMGYHRALLTAPSCLLSRCASAMRFSSLLPQQHECSLTPPVLSVSDDVREHQNPCLLSLGDANLGAEVPTDTRPCQHS